MVQHHINGHKCTQLNFDKISNLRTVKSLAEVKKLRGRKKYNHMENIAP